ncbi:MAG: ATP-binding cassette domain-containing protein, partial [Thermobifida sp.]|nr:ATP-binding cassette domain-containing protein [Thermobifida sp.]
LNGAQTQEALDAVGLAHRAGLKPPQLSGGERQRVAIARVMASRPRIVFADEPTGALDTASAAALLETLAGMCERLGQTVVMVTHDEQAAATTNRIIRLRDGHITGVEAVRRPAGTRVAGSGAHHAAVPSPAAGPAPRMEAR